MTPEILFALLKVLLGVVASIQKVLTISDGDLNLMYQQEKARAQGVLHPDNLPKPPKEE